MVMSSCVASVGSVWLAAVLMPVVEVYRYIGSAKYQLLIWQNLQYRKSVFFWNCTDISTDIFTCTNNLMQCLIVTILCCVDDHFTSLLLFDYGCSEFYRVICAVPRKNSLSHISDWQSILVF